MRLSKAQLMLKIEFVVLLWILRLGAEMKACRKDKRKVWNCRSADLVATPAAWEYLLPFSI